MVVSGHSRTLSPTCSVVLGRGAGADVELVYPEVSRRHAVLEPTGDGWTLTDVSTTGTFLDGRRITKIMVTGVTTVDLGGTRDGVRVTFAPVDEQLLGSPSLNASRQGRLSGVHQLHAQRVRIGRLLDNDVVLDDLLVSRRHAELRSTTHGWELVDLGSGNGTFLNGRRVSKAPITSADVIGIGRNLLQLQGDQLVAYVDSGNNTFEASNLTVRPPAARSCCTTSASRCRAGPCSA